MQHFDRESTIQLRNILLSAGLDAKEVNIYLALLTMGVTSVGNLSKATNLPRTTLYFILERLEQKNFVNVVVQGKIRHYSAVTPQEILSHLHEKQTSLRSLENQITDAMPLFEQFAKKQDKSPIATSYKGFESVKPIYREMLHHEFFGIFNPETMYEQLGKTTADLLYGRDFPLHGRDLLVDGKSVQRYFKEYPQTKDYKYRVLPKFMNIKCDFVAWKDSIAFFSYDVEHTTIVIKNEQMFDMMRQWHNALWSLSSNPESTEKGGEKQ